MATPTTQDPVGSLILFIEEMRQDSAARGVTRLVRHLLLDFYICMVRLLVRLAERRRNRTRPGMVPVVAPDQPSDLRPRESGCLEQRSAEDVWRGGTMDEPSERPGVRSEIEEPIQALQAGAPQIRVRRVKNASALAVARPQYVDNCCWPRWLGPGVVRTTEAVFLEVDSKKWVLGGGDICACFVAN